MGTQHFSKAFFFPNNKRKTEIIILLLLGRPTETTRPMAVFGLSDRAGRSEAARLGASAHGQPGPEKAEGGQRPRHAGVLGVTAERRRGQRPLPTTTEHGGVHMGSARGRQARECGSRGERRSEDAGRRSMSSVAPAMVVRAGTLD
jgi:hypothetical protein